MDRAAATGVKIVTFYSSQYLLHGSVTESVFLLKMLRFSQQGPFEYSTLPPHKEAQHIGRHSFPLVKCRERYRNARSEIRIYRGRLRGIIIWVGVPYVDGTIKGMIGNHSGFVSIFIN